MNTPHQTETKWTDVLAATVSLNLFIPQRWPWLETASAHPLQERIDGVDRISLHLIRCEPVGINNMISYILRHEVPPRGQHRRSVLEGDSPLKYFGVQVSEPQSRYVRAAVANWKEKRPTATF
ncbi:hypothetical protein HBH53_120300 [Parastagonospora nodorum]|nr:hypothetical protein HBH53_120300 [Parastagonospora nodorum]KAH4189925.1 hypothetical protein HBH42_137720 [Parastagonospora nodorum]KAH4850089.1 hypothetical protein HBH75_138020 [Parastagonospora nodorum]KAH4905721.1 hypothetical protein HBI80_093070 [Parastagonospora nodorum]KAH4963699.1 hypothetical protein HBI78_117920 [Parastagonospora nodorum]